jgi:hypothetical protein
VPRKKPDQKIVNAARFAAAFATQGPDLDRMRAELHRLSEDTMRLLSVALDQHPGEPERALRFAKEWTKSHRSSYPDVKPSGRRADLKWLYAVQTLLPHCPHPLNAGQDKKWNATILWLADHLMELEHTKHEEACRRAHTAMRKIAKGCKK